MEAQALDWIEANLGEPLDRKKPYDDLLKDGIILCKYVRLKPLPTPTPTPFFFLFFFFFYRNCPSRPKGRCSTGWRYRNYQWQISVFAWAVSQHINTSKKVKMWWQSHRIWCPSWRLKGSLHPHEERFSKTTTATERMLCFRLMNKLVTTEAQMSTLKTN